MATRTPRARATRVAPSAEPIAPSNGQSATGARAAARRDPDGGHGEIHDKLIAAVAETARLLEADGAMVYLLDPETGHLRFAHDAGIRSARSRAWVRSIRLPIGTGMFGRSVALREVVQTDDYLADTAFDHAPDPDRVVADIGIRSMVAAPLVDGERVFGALGAFSARPSAFSPSQVALVRALADHAAAAMANTLLIEALDQSRSELAKRAEAEQALREIAARITVLREPSEILRDVVKHAGRLVRADGVILDLLDPTTGNLRWTYDDGLAEQFTTEERAGLWISVGVGATGTAVAEDHVVVAGDDLVSLFPPSPGSTAFYERTGFHSMIAAPITGEAGPLGVIEVYSTKRDAFTDTDGGLVGALASQAAIAITNARLIDQLARSQSELAETADAERTLREIAARVSAMRDQGEILQSVIDAAARLLKASGVTIDLIDGQGMAEAWPNDELTAQTERNLELLKVVQVDPSVGVSGMAIRTRAPAWTGEYLGDKRFTHTDDRDEFVRESGTRSVIAAPLIHRDEVLGVVSAFSERPDSFDATDAGLLAALADQAAIAITNSTLLTRLTESEERYRFLVENAPDLVWSVGPDARLTFLSDAVERMIGRRPDELLGQHFGVLVHESSRDVAELDWSAGMAAESQELRGRLNMLGADGEPIPAEFIAMARLDEDGSFAGANGSVRDMRERDRLERGLRESEERYRFLVENSPDVVFATDVDGRFTFISEAIETMTGYQPSETVDQHFSMLVQPETLPIAADRWQKLVADPIHQQVAELTLVGKDGRLTPVEVHSIGIVGPDGKFAGIHGATRDIGERERLQRELRSSEERYRYLVSASPDLVWVTDADGRLSFVSEAAESMLGRAATDLIGRPYWEVFAPEVRREAEVRFKWVSRHPTSVQRSRLPFRHADGHDVLVEITGIGMLDGDRFVGAHGAARDVSDRDRLEGNLRRQAGELAAGEERAHLARELHDSVTQALFSMTLVSRSVELLLDRDVDAARNQLTQLRELQREALAEMRALIFELRPGNLEQDGLTHALKTHTAALQGRIGLPVVVESTLGDERLPLPVEETLYRIAQEALHNVIKHAAARQVRVEVGRGREGVRLRIQDDGKGFDPTHVPAGHLGLAGMQARASRIGASFDCRSVAGKGTTVEVIVPDGVAGAAGAVGAAGAEPGTHRGPASDPSIRDR